MAQVCAQENLYNLLPRLEEKAVRPPRYISTFRSSVKYEAQKNKAPWKTIGPEKVEVPSPKNFLLKGSREPKQLQRQKGHGSKKISTLPPVPQKTDHPIIGVQVKKNFIRTNAVDAVMGKPKTYQPVCVDRRLGDKYLLETSGLVPKFIKKKDYGIIPKYIIKRNEEVKKAQEDYNAYFKEAVREQAMEWISDEERENVLQDLKKAWEETHHEFQCLSLEIDTLPKRMHKERLESHLKQLEHDIKLIENPHCIYIPKK
ncbi:PREDICTED: enkurin [Gavialis gangeticus]|uniref:enkurin n=1 Tax=Gavialis gangeticus TaxID=94835 RepID=UPI00092EC88E|nr:PREDICTED: enkurin [Gavialis gangeticus]XP_019363825.1 PREDICTED: enkurin [Gavialis gangeticus]XP_019363826.1 PREDICTED: enkurin [Gavialis gangeticus]